MLVMVMLFIQHQNSVMFWGEDLQQLFHGVFTLLDLEIAGLPMSCSSLLMAQATLETAYEGGYLKEPTCSTECCSWRRGERKSDRPWVVQSP